MCGIWYDVRCLGHCGSFGLLYILIGIQSTSIGGLCIVLVVCVVLTLTWCVVVTCNSIVPFIRKSLAL
jgi:hypothetical protein